MNQSSKSKRYSFSKYFLDIFEQRIGFTLTDDDKAYILGVCYQCTPHKKIDNKGRNSEYFTFRLNDTLITIVCDGESHKIITCIKETHNRKEFRCL